MYQKFSIIKLFILLPIFLLAKLGADTVTTIPVGYISKSVNANADLRLGVPFKQPSNFVGSVLTVSGTTINVDTTITDVTTSLHYLWVTSGPLLGNWYQVESYTPTSVTVVDGSDLSSLASTNTFEIVPFWTLDTLFPSGGDIPVSSDVFNPVAYVLINDVTQTGINLVAGNVYFYHDGTQAAAGWYDLDDLTPGLTKGDTAITPGSFITIRNETDSPITVTMSGTVPNYSITSKILSISTGVQDSQISNPFPAPIVLGSSELVDDLVIRASPDVNNPTDILLIYETVPTEKNTPADKLVIYHDGTQAAAGWYDLDNLVPDATIDTFELPTGGALVVRRATGSDEVLAWSPPLPYTLN